MNRGPRQPWSPSDLDTLRRLYPDHRTSEIAALLDRPLVRVTVDLVPAPRLGLDGHPMGWVTLPGLTWYDQPLHQSPQQQNLL